MVLMACRRHVAHKIKCGKFDFILKQTKVGKHLICYSRNDFVHVISQKR